MIAVGNNSSITALVNELCSENSTAVYYNQYRDQHTQQNLLTYLEFTKKSQSKIMLVGEAPGYKGCRLTGIPFTCPRNIKANQAPLFCGCRNQLVHKDNTSEMSANAVWEVLEKENSHVLLWNVFPFHPHNLGNPLTNRKPTKSEKQAGIIYLRKILKIFAPTTVVAVGRSSEEVLNRILKPDISKYIRHPSHGGKTIFQAEFLKILHSDDYVSSRRPRLSL